MNPIEKILIVDDTPENLDILSGVLDEYQVMAAINGKIALELANEFNPDLILLDVMMPELDGFEVAEKLRSKSSTSHIPIIFITAKADTKSVVRGFDVGAADYITKPFEPTEVIARVKTHLEIVQQRKFQNKINEILSQKVEEKTYKLKIAKDKAEAAQKLKTEFLAQMSHEIRTPLNAIISLSGLLMEDLKDKVDLEYSDLLSRIGIAGKRIIRTVELLLNYSDVATGSFEPKPDKILLSELCQNIILEYEGLAKEKQIPIEFKNEFTSSIVNIDEYSTRQILMNIIENAIIYTEQGKIGINLTENEKYMIFQCTDTGIGISEEYLPKIFDPFSQEEQGYSRSYDGNGLGLALSKQYCDINNFEIDIESEKGKGSQITVKMKKKITQSI